MEKWEELKIEVKGLKDTLTNKQDKLKTLQTKYENAKESLKGTKVELAKAKDKVAKVEKGVASTKKVNKKEFIQSSEFEEHLSQVVDGAVRNIIYTMFIKYPNFD